MSWHVVARSLSGSKMACLASWMSCSVKSGGKHRVTNGSIVSMTDARMLSATCADFCFWALNSKLLGM